MGADSGAQLRHANEDDSLRPRRLATSCTATRLPWLRGHGLRDLSAVCCLLLLPLLRSSVVVEPVPMTTVMKRRR